MKDSSTCSFYYYGLTLKVPVASFFFISTEKERSNQERKATLPPVGNLLEFKLSPKNA